MWTICSNVIPDILSIILCLSSGTGMSLLPSIIFEMQGFHTHISFAVTYPNRMSECTNFKVLSESKFDTTSKWWTKQSYFKYSKKKNNQENLLTANMNLFLSMQLATMTSLLAKNSVIHCFSGGSRVWRVGSTFNQRGNCSYNPAN